MSRLAAASAWLRSHRPLAGTVTGSVLVVALIAVTALVSPGYTAQKVSLDDATVWVTSDLHQAAGRANPEVGELNSAVRMESGSLAVSQTGQTVVVSDLGGGEARLIDTATAAVADSFALPPGEVGISLTGDRAVIVSRTSGDVWFVPLEALAAFDPGTPADLTLGAGGDVVAAVTGTVFAVSAVTGSVLSIDPVTGEETAPARTIDIGADDPVSITAVGERWVVLDEAAGALIDADGVVPLPGPDGEGAADGDGGVADDGSEGDSDDGRALRLQAPSAAADTVLVATSDALLEVGPGRDIRSLSDGHTGVPAAPVRVGDCSYAGWPDGRSWSRCTSGPGPAEGADAVLPGATASDELVFRTNGGGGVLLSDAVTGRAWDVTRDNALIDDWDALLPDLATDAAAADVVTDQPVSVDPDQRPPVAVDDELGARPGRSTVLPVLLNDYDPNGDVVVIDSVRLPEGPAGTDGTDGSEGGSETAAPDWSVDRISDGQQLQLTLPATASGVISFGYTISDGRGGTAEATVRVTVRGPEENSPPVQSTRASLDVALGGRAETDVRGDWFDPDGDAFFIQSAGVAAPDAVAFTPEGVLAFTDSGQATGEKEVAVTVSDGLASTAGSVGVLIHPAGEAPLVAQGFVATAHVGQEFELRPLEHVTGGGAGLRLTAVPAHDGFSITPDYAGGSVRLTASAVGDVLLEYAVSEGSASAAGVIRVIVTLPPDANTRPVTVPHSAFARPDASVLVDVLAGDFDPAGGVLIVSGADAAPAESGVRIEVIEQRMIRVTLTRPLDAGTVVFGYTVTNGLADARGSVTVVPIPDPAVRQPPVAVADSAAVRVGDVVDIPVLANDAHPDGDALRLDPVLVRGLDAGAGLLFTSGDRLRYLAPATPGDFTAVYRVDGPDGQWATAEVSISVREADPAANAAPVPPLVTARVIAGETVRIPMPLGGIDPDGDSTQFLGIESAPERGAVVATGTDYIDYRAGEYSTGTDGFGYTVVDRLGARATGTIRVGISPRLEGARNPVAAPDEVLVRPGKTVLVRVLENDSDPDGSPLSLTEVEPVTPGVAVAIVDDMLSITAPADAGRYGFVYTVTNARGGTSTSFATLEVRNDAPLARPRVTDTVLPLTDVLAAESGSNGRIDVDVLRNVFFAEGPADELWLSVLPGFAAGAEVVNGRVRVQVGEKRQVIPFSVAHPDDPNVRASGFIWVPGTDDALPQLRPAAPALTVASGAALTIPLNDFVVATGDGGVTLTDPNAVRATHADGSALTTDARTLVYRSADGYFGPASVSFEVTDGTAAGARTATLVLPITVTPRDDQPPVFGGAVLEFEPGQQRVIDLARLTTAPTPGAALSFQVLEPRPAGFTAVLLGSQLTISVDAAARKGSKGAFSIGVQAGGLAGKSGRIDLSVVPSTRPLAVPATDTVVAPRGATTTVDVLANDGATNPFPEKPLTVTAVKGVEAGGLPAGVQVVPSAAKNVLQITVAADAAATDFSVRYQVQDGTGEAERAVWGTVRIAVQDRPGRVSGLAVTAFGDRTVTVAFSPGLANNAPITGFEATARTATGATTVTRCAGTACAVGTPGNGPSNAVSISVRALNAIGSSDPAVYAAPVWSDLLPSAPGPVTVAPLDGALAVRWAPATVAPGGSAVEQYDVTANGQPVATLNADGSGLDGSGPDGSGGGPGAPGAPGGPGEGATGCDASGCSIVVRGLANGSSSEISVTARNGAFPALAVWPSAGASGTPYGAPVAGVVTAVARLGDGPGSVTVDWEPFAPNGDAVAGYFVQQLAPGVSAAPTGAQACTVSSPAPGRPSPPQPGGDVVAQQSAGADARSVTFTGLTAVDARYSFVVWGYNAAGCAVSAVASAVAYPSPGAVDAAGVVVSMVEDGLRVEPRIDQAPTSTPVAGATVRYRVQQVDGADAAVGRPAAITLPGLPRPLTGGALGENYRFRLQACYVWAGVEVCGDYSASVTAPEPSISFDFGTPPRYDGVSWGWANAPRNGALVPEFSCGSLPVPADPAAADDTVTVSSCTPAVPAEIGSAWLQVRIEGRDYVYFG